MSVDLKILNTSENVNITGMKYVTFMKNLWMKIVLNGFVFESKVSLLSNERNIYVKIFSQMD